MTLRYMRYLATGLVTILLLLPALSVELFRYRGAAKDGGTLEYVFEAGASLDAHEDNSGIEGGVANVNSFDILPSMRTQW
jgi:hypothetical protein